MEVSTSLFSWDAERKMFVAEISDLGQGFRFERMYPDAADIGLVLRSHKTEVTARYYVVDQNGDDDDFVWILKPCIETLKKHPQLAGTEIHILND
jgi:hypothetical protein